MRPGWLEVVVALVSYLVLGGLIVAWIVQTPDDQAATRGIVGMMANGVAGMIAFLAAYAIRIRDLSAFGFRRTSGRWILASAALGFVAFGLSVVTETIYFHFITEPNTQGDFQAAAKAGYVSLVVLLFAGAIGTPLGEELVFRGVVANALNRYGAAAGTIGSAAIFAIAHGPSVKFFNAFMIGILAGVLFRATNSIWSTLTLHVIYNGIWLIQYSRL